MNNYDEKIMAVRKAVFFHRGRLLERRLYSCLFDSEDKEAFLSALLAYQNKDGGFGNGIEPDLMTPESTGIGLETALSYFTLIEYIPEATSKQILGWIDRNQDDDGFIPHPPKTLQDYPHQPWWQNRDDSRIFTIIGLLSRLGVQIPEEINSKATKSALSYPIPDELQEYDYPIYVYAFCSNSFSRRDEILSDFKNRFPIANKRLPVRFLLLNRYWWLLSSLLDKALLEEEAKRFMDTIDENGFIPTGYPDLPWWEPIMVLDGIAALRRIGLL